MTVDPFELYIIAFFSAWFALIAGFIWLTWRIGNAIDERHTRRSCDCDEAYKPDEYSVTIGPCKPGECRVCDEAYEAEIEKERNR
ncbi:hypothetical protein LCGC14_1231060 [marine sediment metagenome]|uniref:Uncharacterized protein n=1 Tax=marine sediment metagenome TaxID=412755 RepID=A0A0F9L8J0_9ZZZZ